jgi:hypothetical protein
MASGFFMASLDLASCFFMPSLDIASLHAVIDHRVFPRLVLREGGRGEAHYKSESGNRAQARKFIITVNPARSFASAIARARSSKAVTPISW